MPFNRLNLFFSPAFAFEFAVHSHVDSFYFCPISLPFPFNFFLCLIIFHFFFASKCNLLLNSFYFLSSMSINVRYIHTQTQAQAELQRMHAISRAQYAHRKQRMREDPEYEA